MADKEYKAIETKVYIISVSSEYNSDLKVGDQIIKFDDKKIENVAMARE